jgi:CRISPR-associated endonuclease/helicase Cas3
VTAAELPAVLVEAFVFERSSAALLASLAGGHHGVVPSSGEVQEAQRTREIIGNAAWKKVRAELVVLIAEVLRVTRHPLPSRPDNATAMVLAGLGVGTVDQTLLAALQTRHVFVRHFGLAHKTVIIDEVHAYDAYMVVLLERLLEWLGALGASVVMLSATLPKSRREKLIDAYRRGLGSDNPICNGAAYPRVSWLDGAGSCVRHIETSPASRKTILMEWVGAQTAAAAPFELGVRLQTILKDGGCAAVICNTVSRAQEMYLALKPYFSVADGELDLFHARYLFEDRDIREQRALGRFGKDRKNRPHRAVLVATQVIEQSLDLDFDLMVTEVAPIDLLLQRAGRLHRHERPPECPRPRRLETPQLWLLRPAISGDVPLFGSANEGVYDSHILLRSWLELRRIEHEHDFRVAIPDSVEELIENVYDESRAYPAELEAALKKRWKRTRERQRRELESDHREADDRCIKRPSFLGPMWRISRDELEEDDPTFHKVHQALTRLSGINVPVVCLYQGKQGPALDRNGTEPVDVNAVPGVNLARRLLARSVAITREDVALLLLNVTPPPGWRRSALLRHHRLLLIDGEQGATIGKFRLRLDAEIGVVIEGTQVTS